MVRIDGPRLDVDDITELEWDDQNRLVSIIEPLSAVVLLSEYDSLGRVTRTKQGSKSEQIIHYDQQSNVTKIARRGGSILFDYDGEGRLTSQTNEQGQQVKIEYDEAGRAVQLIDDAGQRSTLAYNTDSQTIEQSYFGIDGTLLRRLASSYDSYSRLSATTEEKMSADGQLYQYQQELQRADNGEVSAKVDVVLRATLQSYFEPNYSS